MSEGSSGTETADTGSEASSVTQPTASEAGPECVVDSDCGDGWQCIDGVCNFEDWCGTCCDACCYSYNGCDYDDSGESGESGEMDPPSCASDDECNSGVCLEEKCMTGESLPACDQQLETAALEIPAGTWQTRLALVDLAPDDHATLVFTDGVGISTKTQLGSVQTFDAQGIENVQLFGAADVDGDGREEIMTAGTQDGADVVATYAIGDDVVTLLGTTPGAGAGRLADLDGNGRVDLVLSVPDVGLSAMPGLADGTFAAPIALAVEGLVIGAGTLDVDPLEELVSETRRVFFGGPDFQVASTLDVSTLFADVEIHTSTFADFDGDGVDEILFATSETSALLEYSDIDGARLGDYVIPGARWMRGAANIVGNGARDVVLHNTVISRLAAAPCRMDYAPVAAAGLAVGNYEGGVQEEIVFLEEGTYAFHIARLYEP